MVPSRYCRRLLLKTHFLDSEVMFANAFDDRLTILPGTR